MNRLASETSPYLLQHADNPVEWYPWGEEAFAQARELDRPVMLSIGYSSCHWCHVMAHESFEDPKTAEELNARFVAIKVDREERPDVDAIYMEAVQALSGRGGWPMTVFLTPDARPFYAGTYFPGRDHAGMPSFRRVLDAVDEAWRNSREEVEHQAEALTDAVSQRVRLDATATEDASKTTPYEVAETWPRLLDAAAGELSRRYDERFGGFGPAPKFPHPALIELCLQHHRLTGHEPSLRMATKTLMAMAAGGIYDHVGGGFHRYSTDERWTVPHFEKMLYDQAGLLRAYLHVWQATGERQWLGVIEETVEYVLRDLGSEGGGLCSAEDADSEGEEGRFYVWSVDEIAAVLPGAAGDAAVGWYGATADGNFEGRNIPRRPPEGPLERTAIVEDARRRLFEARSHRVRPGRDDKVLTEWNAMFASALAEAASATGRGDWADAAQGVAEFLLAELRRPSDGRWLRSWQGGRARHLAYAADHAWVVDMLTRLSELTGRAIWLERAGEAAAELVRLFYEAGSPLNTTGCDAEKLVVRPMEVSDGATPSATSVGAAALLRLSALNGDLSLREVGESLLGAAMPFASQQPLALAGAVAAAALSGGGITEVVIAGDRPELVRATRQRYSPYQVLAWGERHGSAIWEGRDLDAAYVCRRYVCQAPSATVEDLELRLESEMRREQEHFAEAVGGARPAP